MARPLLRTATEASRVMLKLTRLNNHVVAINPDHIGWADTNPDTTLFLIGGEKIIVRETLDELIALVIEFRRSIRIGETSLEPFNARIGDPPRLSVPPRPISEIPSRASLPPLSRRGGR
ncbi:MAG: flagellar FlbD family protein [Polyangiaceae bacterium]